MTDLEWMQTMTGSDDVALLTALLETAEEEILAYTNRTVFPVGLAACRRKWALIAYNRRGMEGESSRNEGGISASFVDIPAELRAQLASFRLARVSGKVYEVLPDEDATGN